MVGEIQVLDCDLIDLVYCMGYVNFFEVICVDIVWWFVLVDGIGLEWWLYVWVWGSQSVIVVGYQGQIMFNGFDEICCDCLGCICICFYWQGWYGDVGVICWVCVGQCCVGLGMGMQFLLCIGQEVFVQFIENDLE